jgi:hypothetical protein
MLELLLLNCKLKAALAACVFDTETLRAPEIVLAAAEAGPLMVTPVQLDPPNIWGAMKEEL